MKGFVISCSSLGKIMTKSSGLTEIEEKKLQLLIEKDSKSKERTRLEEKKAYKPDFDLSEGAKTHVRDKVDRLFFGYTSTMQTRATLKGTETEGDVIELYNNLEFENYEKNEVRLYKDGLTGECDIDSEIDDLIIDFKSSETLSSFPKLPEYGYKSLYEWQGRGYMKLYERGQFKLIYGVVDTPDHLLNDWDDLEQHYVSHIDPKYRITVALHIERDFKLEKLIDYKVKEAHRYAYWYHEQLLNKNT
jgi:hypothetical protein